MTKINRCVLYVSLLLSLFAVVYCASVFDSYKKSDVADIEQTTRNAEESVQEVPVLLLITDDAFKSLKPLFTPIKLLYTNTVDALPNPYLKRHTPPPNLT